MPPRKTRKVCTNPPPQRRQRSPTPSPSPSPPQSPVDDPASQGVPAGLRPVLPGVFIDEVELRQVKGILPLVTNLEELDWLDICKFRCKWSTRLVNEFYASVRFNGLSDNPAVSFTVNGVQGTINCSDIGHCFDVPFEMVATEYARRTWSHNWPLEAQSCIDELNNGRHAEKAAQKPNLRANQRIALKLVRECLLPVLNNDSKLTNLQMFLVCCMTRKVQINLPSLMIRHMAYEKNKDNLPYGMFITRLLQWKGVDISDYQLAVAPMGTIIGRNSLRAQEVYVWGDEVYAKWEVFHYFEMDRAAIWKHNKVKEPAAPPGWTPCGQNREQLAPLPQEPASHHTEAGSSASSSTRRTDRQMLDAIWDRQQEMWLAQQASDARQQEMWTRQQEMWAAQQSYYARQDAFQRAYDVTQSRQTDFLRQASENFGMTALFESLYHPSMDTDADTTAPTDAATDPTSSHPPFD